MERDTSTTADDLNRPKGNSLKENYSVHDRGEAELVKSLDAWGYTIVAEGIDMRDDDGSEGVIYDDALDFRVEDGEGNPCGLIDVKTKTGPKWMGMFNMRHFDKYQDAAEERGLPTFIVMYLVDDEDIESAFVYEFDKHENSAVHSKHSDLLRTFPDGNHATFIKSFAREDLSYLKERLDYQRDVVNRKSESVRRDD